MESKVIRPINVIKYMEISQYKNLTRSQKPQNVNASQAKWAREQESRVQFESSMNNSQVANTQ